MLHLSRANTPLKADMAALPVSNSMEDQEHPVDSAPTSTNASWRKQSKRRDFRDSTVPEPKDRDKFH